MGSPDRNKSRQLDLYYMFWFLKELTVYGFATYRSPTGMMDLPPSNVSSRTTDFILLQASSNTGNINCSGKYTADLQFVLIPIIYITIFVVGTVGNTVIIVGLTFCIQVKSVANLYIVNLAIADLSFVATLPFWAVDMSGKYKWIFGSFLCKFCSVISTVNLYASVFLLTCLSIDRHYSIVRPMRALKNRTFTKAKMATLGVWASAFALSIPIMYFRDTYYSSYSHHIVCSMKFSSNGTFWTIILDAVKFIVGFVIPFIIQGVCYFFIYRKISAKNWQKKTKIDKILRLVVTMMLAFLLCWLPFHVINIFKLLARFRLIHDCWTIQVINNIFKPFSVCVAFSNSFINPLIYFFSSKRFRNQLLKSLKHPSSVLYSQKMGIVQVGKKYKMSLATTQWMLLRKH
ncbi:type-1 angiotensin II receptor A-like [Gastrophryne carolinensis]